MRLSQTFTKTKHQAPKDEVARNAQLLIRAGFIHKEMAGVYTLLPLGLKVINNIVGVIREEMNAAGSQEIQMPALQRPEIWQKTNRWDDTVVDNWFKTTLKDGRELGLATTHEEDITAMLKNYVGSYKHLPQYIYQFQTKFRNELRAKSGILRTREFLMKDLYSFCKDSSEHDRFYEGMKKVYLNIFKRLGIGDLTYITVASGQPFTTDFSHEFQTLCDAGEDTIYLDRKQRIAINKEVYSKDTIKKLGVKEKDLEEVKASEVGNIFPLGTRFSKELDVLFTDDKGKSQPIVMGSYGIGPARVMGVITEIYSDDKGLVWPKEVAPAKVHLVALGNDSGIMEEAELQYKKLAEHAVEVIFDDRPETSAGAKLADADLMGVPLRIVISKQTLAKHSLEVKKRTEAQHSLVKIDQLAKYISQAL